MWQLPNPFTMIIEMNQVTDWIERHQYVEEITLQPPGSVPGPHSGWQKLNSNSIANERR